MAQFESQRKAFEDAGVGLAFVAGQQRDGLLGATGYFRKNPFSFPFLLDDSRDVLRAYGVYVPITYDGIRVANVSAFLIGADRVVRWRHIGRHQLDRVTPDRLLEEIRARIA